MNVPARPGVVIRAPEREKSKERKFEMEESPIVVYVNSGVCPYGRELLSLAGGRGVKVRVVDVSNVPPPAWLPGTPSLVHNGDVYCGDAAFSFVGEIPEEKNVSPVGKTKDTSAGCGISQAFAPPKEIDVDESQFSASTDEMMQRLMAGRR